MNNDSIYILSAPVNAGKTTALKNWAHNKPEILGILMPDENGERKIYSLGLDQYFNLIATNGTAATQQVGNYRFLSQAFENAQEVLELEAQYLKPGWLVIDEVGKLEMEQQQGFEPIVTDLVQRYREGKAHGKLLLVVRDSLLEQARAHYQLQDAKTIGIDALSSLA